MNPIFTIVNPAAGGGRCGKRTEAALGRLTAGGLVCEVHKTHSEGHGTQLARDAYLAGHRRFLAVGGDGTGYEVVNGLFPLASEEGERPTVGMLPLGTGNSFLRDFGVHDADSAIDALLSRRTRACDVIRCTHTDGVLHYINLLSVGFSAEAGALTNRRFKSLGALGYIFAVLSCLRSLKHPTFPMRINDADDWQRDGRTLLSFSNSRYTGGTMMMAPEADTGDGLLDVIDISPLTPLQLARAFPRIFKGTHTQMDTVTQARAQRVDFDLDGPVDAMIDGEILSLNLKSLEVLPGALEIMA